VKEPSIVLRTKTSISSPKDHIAPLDHSRTNYSTPAWTKGAPTPYTVRGAVLLVSAVGRCVTASRLEVLNGYEPETNGKLTLLGSIELEGESDIISLVYIKTVSNGWCVGTWDLQLKLADMVDDLCAVSVSRNLIVTPCPNEMPRH